MLPIFKHKELLININKIKLQITHIYKHAFLSRMSTFKVDALKYSSLMTRIRRNDFCWTSNKIVSHGLALEGHS
jgi:hypothetical protein